MKLSIEERVSYADKFQLMGSIAFVPYFCKILSRNDRNEQKNGRSQPKRESILSIEVDQEYLLVRIFYRRSIAAVGLEPTTPGL